MSRLALIDTAAAPDNILQSSGRRMISLLAAIPGVFEAMIRRSTVSMVHADTLDEVKAQIFAVSLRIGPEVFARQNRAVARRRDPSGNPERDRHTDDYLGASRHQSPASIIQEFNRLVGGSTLEIIEQCGHLPPIEQPAAVANVSKRWLVREA